MDQDRNAQYYRRLQAREMASAQETSSWAACEIHIDLAERYALIADDMEAEERAQNP